METVEYSGKVYEIGKLYMFKDSGCDHHELGELNGIIKDSVKYPFVMEGGGEWEIVVEVPSYGELGSITAAPIDLIDGNAYMFDHLTYKNEIGVYCKSDKDLTSVRLCHRVVDCTNIREMMVKL